MKPRLLILYDGHCLLCNRLIANLLDRDKHNQLRAAPLQTYSEIQKGRFVSVDEHIDSVVLITNGNKVSYRSDAILDLKAAFSSFSWFYRSLKIIPRSIRDSVYDFIARHRASWFGRSESCVMPPQQTRNKYLMTGQELMHYLSK